MKVSEKIFRILKGLDLGIGRMPRVVLRKVKRDRLKGGQVDCHRKGQVRLVRLHQLREEPRKLLASFVD